MLNKCKDCQKAITYRAKRCRACSCKYVMQNLCNREKIGKANKGRKNGNWKNGITQKNYYCLDCQKSIHYHTALYGSGRCNSCSIKKKHKLKIYNYLDKNNPNFGNHKLKGRNNPRFGILLKPNWVKYKNTWFRSNWELWFAQFLTLSNIKWKYEFKTFDLGDTTYTPDFYLPEFDCYVEIKGYFSTYANRKFNNFKKEYSNINIKIFDQKELNKIGVML